MGCFTKLKERGFIYQVTDEENLPAILNNGKLLYYTGFDATANSLHVGHLIPIMAMLHLQTAGHIPIVLVGGATALIGDPSGKQEARPILSKEDVGKNADALKKQLSRFIKIDTGNAVFVNNYDWFKDMLYIDFLRDIGYRFSVNKMLTADSVKMRLESGGISFLEFSYMLLQAYDFYILNKNYDCSLQLGGQEQWGNIVAGVDLVRRISSVQVYGFTCPLLTNSQGEKLGKTAAGAVWLDENKTSVFDYYQFWRNTQDSDVRRLSLLFTTLPVDEINELCGSDNASQINRAKEILAFEATKLAHGEEAARKTYLAAGTKFGFADPECKIKTSSSVKNIKPKTDSISDLPTYKISLENFTKDGIWIVKLMTDSGLCASNSEARRLIQGGGAYFNEEKISDLNWNLKPEDFQNKSVILKAGKKNLKRIVLS